ncbi:MAG TPA: RDD family protein [Blastocatellia bacterium]|nr:RDD family protein [Blastocatellia bacterium]
MSDQIGNASKPRIFGFIIDNLFATILGFIIVAVVNPQNQPVGGLIVCVVYLLYFFVFEALWSRTPAKFLMGLKVQRTDGTASSTTTAAIRTLARILEANPLLFVGCPPV